MFVLMAYDVSSKRAGRILKTARRYLNWVQNSVLEGEITAGDMKALKRERGESIDPEHDSVLFYTWREPWQLSRYAMGPDQPAERSNFI